MDGFIISRVQNESIFKPEKVHSNNLNKNINQNKQSVSNESTVRINLPPAINQENEKISIGLMMTADDSSNTVLSKNLNASKNCSIKTHFIETQRPEKKQGSFKKVLLSFHVNQRYETTSRNFRILNVEHRRLFKVKNK